ncbi:hypothetical protein LSAT2_017013 [Lamellibrachia satsuma]|nr:hypothetical protein LSAT2_017013 [Lamellibrachia satsuma]
MCSFRHYALPQSFVTDTIVFVLSSLFEIFCNNGTPVCKARTMKALFAARGAACQWAEGRCHFRCHGDEVFVARYHCRSIPTTHRSSRRADIMTRRTMPFTGYCGLTCRTSHRYVLDLPVRAVRHP